MRKKKGFILTEKEPGGIQTAMIELSRFVITLYKESEGDVDQAVKLAREKLKEMKEHGK